MIIVSSASGSAYLDELRSLFVSEWDEVDSFEGNEFGSSPPAPLLAVDNEQLLGGLAFTWCQPPNFSEVNLWVNAVFVKPEYRGKGIATQLVKAATHPASLTDETELFVFTEVPELYSKAGWQHVSNSGKDHVLKALLTSYRENT